MPLSTRHSAHATLVVFVHGMGRTPLSGWPLLHRLKRAGLRTATFGYAVTFESFTTIQRRLVSRLTRITGEQDYVLVGHSLGGVLIRAALNSLPQHVKRPSRVFLLGSPLQASRLAVRLKRNALYRTLTGDCGQLLASPERMNEIGALREFTTSIVGICRIANGKGPFGNEPNDGIVSVGEASASWLSDQRQVPVFHTLLPASGEVAELILREIVPNAE